MEVSVSRRQLKGRGSDFPGGTSGKEITCQCRRLRDMVWSLGWEDPLEESMALQYSWLENSMDRGAWWATVHRIAKSQTWLKQLNTHIYAVYMSIPISQFILLLFFPLVVHTFILYICVSTWFAKINFIVVWLIHKEIHIFKVYISIGLDICKQPQYHHHNQGNKRVQLLPKSPCIPLCMCVCVC